MISASRAKSIGKALCGWYRSHARDLPWRRTDDPYAIWVSEIMLQQTQVDRVIDFYGRFLRKFPTIEDLARARWGSILPVWRGLGYYRRARNMLKTARIVVKQHGGEFPADPTQLQELPGIGVYTANAIASFAYGQAVAAIDTNLRRVLVRTFGKETIDPDIEVLFQSAKRSAPVLNHALMDIGSIFCRARSTDCPSCPLLPFCKTKGVGRGTARTKRVAEDTDPSGPNGVVDVGAACIIRNGSVLIAKQRRGGWEFPGGKREPGEDIRACLKREIQEELGIEVAVRPSFCKEITENNGVRYRLHFCRCQILRGEPKRTEHNRLKWVDLMQVGQEPLCPSNRNAAKILSRKR